MFGSETFGLPEKLVEENLDRSIRIPMLPTLRCLNLSNAVAVVCYEVLRQLDYPQLSSEGELTGREEPDIF